MTDCDALTYDIETCCATPPNVVVPVPPPIVTPPPPPSTPVISSIDVELFPPTAIVGSTAQAVATVYDTNGNVITGVTVTWVSDDTTVATIDASGAITTLKAGSVNIRAALQLVTGSAILTVQAAPPPTPIVATVTVTLTPTSVQVGDPASASAVLRDSNGNVITGVAITWQSSNPAIATIDSQGAITTLLAGTTNITATAQGVSDFEVLTVTAGAPPPPVVATVTVTVSPSTVTAGDSAVATAVAKDSNGNVISGLAIAWASSAPAVATIDIFGVITTLTAGSTSITAVISGITGMAVLTVNAVTPPPPPPPVTNWPGIPAFYNKPTGLQFDQVNGRFTGTVITTPFVQQSVTVNFVDSGNAVTNGTNLQTIINQSAGAGIRRRVIIPVGTLFRMNMEPRVNNGGGWFVFEVANYQTPAVPPSSSNGLFIIESPNAFAAIQTQQLSGNNPTKNHGRYAFRGAEIRFDAGLGLSEDTYGAIVRVGDFDAVRQGSLAAVPDGYYFEGCWIHGWPTRHSRRGIEWHCSNLHLFRTRISEIHNKKQSAPTGGDSHPIWGWNGPGPLFVDDSVLSGGDECAGTGGATPGIQGLVPADQHYRNTLTEKPASMATNDWGCKNHMEWKSARRVLVENCKHVGFPQWYDNTQQLVYVWKRTDENGAYPAAAVEDFLAYNCSCERVPNLLGYAVEGTGISNPARNYPKRIAIVNFLGKDMNEPGDQAVGNNPITCAWYTGYADDVHLDHLTLVTDTGSTPHGTFRAFGILTTNFRWTNSLIEFNGQLPPTPNTGGITSLAGQGNLALASVFGGVIDIRALRFLKVNVTGAEPAAIPGYPAGCRGYSVYANVGFRNIAAGDFGLLLTSAAKNAATDGFDIGVHNYDALIARLATVPV